MRSLVVIACLLTLPLAASADHGAALQCPPQAGLIGPNLAPNASFESVGPNGSSTQWQLGDPLPAHSAAANWQMHTNNAGALVRSSLIKTHAPGPNGARMLHFIARGSESGIFTPVASPPNDKMMFSVFVFVNRGFVTIQASGGLSGPYASSTKTGEWEQLRVCTDGTVPIDTLVIYNQHPRGGDFYVDRAEARQLP